MKTMMMVLVVPLAMVLIGITIPFLYTNMIGVLIGALIAGSSVFIFRAMIKNTVSNLNKHYESTLAALLKSSLVCPKCKTKWEVGAQSCVKCGFSAKIKSPKAVKKE